MGNGQRERMEQAIRGVWCISPGKNRHFEGERPAGREESGVGVTPQGAGGPDAAKGKKKD